MDELVKKAEILIEALPYIQTFAGKTIVIKYGGAAMENDALKHSVMQDVVLMKYIGMNPVVVHGGGNQISEWMRRVGKEAEFTNDPLDRPTFLRQFEPKRPVNDNGAVLVDDDWDVPTFLRKPNE